MSGLTRVHSVATVEVKNDPLGCELSEGDRSRELVGQREGRSYLVLGESCHVSPCAGPERLSPAPRRLGPSPTKWVRAHPVRTTVPGPTEK